MSVIVQNTSFASVNAGDSPIILTCKDNNGNTFNRTTIEIDTSSGKMATVILPDLSSLGDNLISEIVLINSGGGNSISINTFDSFQFISGREIKQANKFSVKIGNTVLRPITEKFWQVF